MASPSSIRELRHLSKSSLSTTFTAANNSAWAADTADKLRISGYESDLKHILVADPTQRQRITQKGKPFSTKKEGTFGYSFFLAGRTDATTIDENASIVGEILGGVENAVTDDAVDTSGTSTTTKLYATGIGAAATVGRAVLIGVKGDGRGDGEVRRVSAAGTDYIDLDMALKDVPIENDVIRFATTLYVDPTLSTDYTHDFLAIGHAANDQQQMIGCQASQLALTGGVVGELPSIKASFIASDWQNVPVSELDQLEADQAMLGNDPVSSNFRRVMFGDKSSTTRNMFCTGDVTIENLGAFFSQYPCQNGNNGIGGWTRIEQDIVASFAMLYDEDAGIADDLDNNTEKQLMIQYGHAAQACVAIDIQRCALNADPSFVDLEGSSARQISLLALEGDLASTDLGRSPIKIHIF